MKRFLLIFAAVFFFFAFGALSEEEMREITQDCAITADRFGAYRMWDGDIKEYWIAKSDYSVIEIEIPEDQAASGILIEWFLVFDRFDVAEYDKNGRIQNEYTSENYFKGLVSYLPLMKDTKKVEIKVYKEGKISEIHVYSDGIENPDIQKWENPAQKVDIMLLVAHQDDEVLWFGGLMPYYSAVRDKSVQVVFMTTTGRFRIRESLNCIWKAGVKHIPEIIGYKDSYVYGLKAEELWGGRDNIDRSLVMRIRRYKPEVIVTHDIMGEYGHPQHKLIASRIVSAVEAAADPTRYSDSYELYGAWEVKKVYLHLGDTDVIYMDWETPSDALDGKTPLEVAEEAYLEHKSQLMSFNMDMGKEYDYTKFSLVYTTVGPDILKNDFLENTEMRETE